jgi:hypothetical protein
MFSSGYRPAIRLKPGQDDYIYKMIVISRYNVCKSHSRIVQNDILYQVEGDRSVLMYSSGTIKMIIDVGGWPTAAWR